MTPKSVIVVHPDSNIRRALQTALEKRGIRIATDQSSAGLLACDPGLRPDLVLLDRSLAGGPGVDLLSEISRKWKETVTVFLPEDLGAASLCALLSIVDRLLGMQSTRELLAV
jgi:DNA-binding response OmpR family regulator